MHELAGSFFTFPMVLRDPSAAETEFARDSAGRSTLIDNRFPPGSPRLFELLCCRDRFGGTRLVMDSLGGLVAQIRVASVLFATFQTCFEWMDQDDGAKGLNTPQGWRDELYGSHKSSYDLFYAQVADAVWKARADAV